MNDKCAAGTGRFLEVMATALGYSLEEFSDGGAIRRKGGEDQQHVHGFRRIGGDLPHSQGAARHEVALGIHRAIVSRSVALLKRVSRPQEVFFAGGVAMNKCVRRLIGQEFDAPVFVPPDPQIVGAFGAALRAHAGRCAR